jgi:hypothetical protein
MNRLWKNQDQRVFTPDDVDAAWIIIQGLRELHREIIETELDVDPDAARVMLIETVIKECRKFWEEKTKELKESNPSLVIEAGDICVDTDISAFTPSVDAFAISVKPKELRKLLELFYDYRPGRM